MAQTAVSSCDLADRQSQQCGLGQKRLLEETADDRQHKLPRRFPGGDTHASEEAASRVKLEGLLSMAFSVLSSAPVVGDVAITGPPDLGGRLAELLWGVRIEFSSPIEYLLLRLRMSTEERQALPGARRVADPQLLHLARCSRAVRQSIVAAVAARRFTMEPDATENQRSAAVEMCVALRKKFPESWSRIGCNLREALAMEMAESNLPAVVVGV
eukprot:TRINITY_DN44030_c0_g1_i1.p1 TRINITY_DN44030_c0_g1~~TRINITY_DN44030_c0_g1_i1.p1  ORF type:complete len:238 (-),score=42.27 TRINITY_DN44030_c0_g1_i1:315-956(-)